MVASVRPRHAVLTSALVALTVLVSAAWAFGGQGSSAQESSQARLEEVRDRIAAMEENVDALRSRLLDMAARVAAEEAEQQELVMSVAVERGRLSAAQRAYAEAKRLLDERVRAAYMGSGGMTLEALLGAPTLSDLTLVLEAQNRQAERDGALAVRTGDLQQQAATSESTLSAMLTRHSDLLARLDERRDELNRSFAEQQELLKALTAQRKELQRLTQTAGVGSVRSAGMTITFDQWAERFLRELAVPVCQNNVIAVVAWETAEYTAAGWNPLATTLPMRGATNFNSAGVKNYRSLKQGLQASVSTLLRGVSAHGYGAIIAGLAECASPAVTAEAIRASNWCHGCAGGHYVTSLVPSVEAYFDGSLG